MNQQHDLSQIDSLGGSGNAFENTAQKFQDFAENSTKNMYEQETNMQTGLQTALETDEEIESTQFYAALDDENEEGLYE